MGFAYKTSWIAVRSRSSVEVADALHLTKRRALSWAEGTALGYRDGIFVGPPMSGWTLAHGHDLAAGINLTSSAFVAWLSALSQALGEVQYFGTHRVVEWHQWAWALDGAVVRAYAVADGDVELSVGALTSVEREAGAIARPLDAESETWSDEEWDAWSATIPDEDKVIQVAARWSINPATLDDALIVEPGIFGKPDPVRPR